MADERIYASLSDAERRRLADANAGGSPPAAADEEPSSQELEDLFGVIGDFFGWWFPPPRDVLDGCWSAVKNVTVGILAGVTVAVAVPFNNARSGLAGFTSSLVKGVLAGITVSIVATCAGLVQTFRGLVRTPEAVKRKLNGDRWSARFHEWEKGMVDLPALADDMAQQQEASRRPAKTVVDMAFYDLLGAPSDASTSALRKRFYAESLKWHPDKNPSEEAKVRFQKLNEAYQVLSDDQKRDTYDRMGAAAVRSDVNLSFVDPGIFFAVLFGTDAFEPYIGQLDLAVSFDAKTQATLWSLAEAQTDRLGFYKAQWENFRTRRRKEQLQREVELARELCRRVEPFVQGDAG
jgi:hypothetical protein